MSHKNKCQYKEPYQKFQQKTKGQKFPLKYCLQKDVFEISAHAYLLSTTLSQFGSGLGQSEHRKLVPRYMVSITNIKKIKLTTSFSPAWYLLIHNSRKIPDPSKVYIIIINKVPQEISRVRSTVSNQEEHSQKHRSKAMRTNATQPAQWRSKCNKSLFSRIQSNSQKGEE